MAVSLTTLTGPIYLPDGATPIGGRVSFELSSWDREEGEALIISGPIYSDIDENGEFSVQLFTTTSGVNSVHYKMFVIWDDSTLAQSYVNDIYVSSPSPHYTKKYIGSFGLAGVGPFKISDLNIVSELTSNSFDVLMECLAYKNAAETAATAAATSAASSSAVAAVAEVVMNDALELVNMTVNVLPIERTATGDGVINTLVFPGVYVDKERFYDVDIGGAGQLAEDFTLSNDGVNTTLTFVEPFPAGAVARGKVLQAMNVAQASYASPIFTGTTTIGSALFRALASPADTDVMTLTQGSAFGAVIEAPAAGQMVIGIRENDIGDALTIVSGGGNYSVDETYDTLVAQFRSNGNVGIGKVPTVKFDVNGASQFVGNMTLTGLLSGTAVTQTAFDTTAGRLLKVGDFGLGGAGVALTGTSSIASRALRTGVYQYLANTVTGGPETAAWQHTLFVQYDLAQNRRNYLSMRTVNTAANMKMWFGSEDGAGAINWLECLNSGQMTTSATDATAGRITKVGDYGLPGAISLTSGDNLNNLTASGVYYNPSAGNTSGNNYPISAAGSLLNMYRSSNNWTQTYIAFAGTAVASSVRIFTRSQGSAGWSPWVEQYHQGNILGTVSQASGVPTGKIIERGSDANGEYVRYADGTQICWHRIGPSIAIDQPFLGGFRSLGQAWTFPNSKAFSDVPVVTVTPEGVTSGASGITTGTPGLSSVNWAVTAFATQTAATRAVMLHAIGRWY